MNRTLMQTANCKALFTFLIWQQFSRSNNPMVACLIMKSVSKPLYMLLQTFWTRDWHEWRVDAFAKAPLAFLTIPSFFPPTLVEILYRILQDFLGSYRILQDPTGSCKFTQDPTQDPKWHHVV